MGEMWKQENPEREKPLTVVERARLREIEEGNRQLKTPEKLSENVDTAHPHSQHLHVGSYSHTCNSGFPHDTSTNTQGVNSAATRPKPRTHHVATVLGPSSAGSRCGSATPDRGRCGTSRPQRHRK